MSRTCCVYLCAPGSQGQGAWAWECLVLQRTDSCLVARAEAVLNNLVAWQGTARDSRSEKKVHFAPRDSSLLDARAISERGWGVSEAIEESSPSPVDTVK